jgi:hypothetical protein
MRFSAIVVLTFFALQAQVAPADVQPAENAEKLSCATEVDPCLEVVISDDDVCDGETVKYCLQPKSKPSESCKFSSDTYRHMNVYVDGINVDLTNSNPGIFPKATCTDVTSPSTSCDYGFTSNSCYALDNYASFGPAFPPEVISINAGLQCGDVKLGICVTVPLAADRTHAEIVFAVEDKSGCEEPTMDWTCSSVTEGFGNSCSCGGSKSACIYQGITSCRPPTTPPNGEGGAQGDPHFKTWRGQHFDFHGECDLVLLHSSEFGSGLGLDVHIRTKLRRDMSYISSATVRIGTDILEVESQGLYYLNGVANAELPSEFSGFAFSHTQPTDKQHEFAVHLGSRERIKVKTYKDFVSVLIEQGKSKNFGDSVGLMGDFGEGRMIARDGKTILDDARIFGQEWQVLDTEPTLFQTLRLPQHPNACTLPTPIQASQLRRRLLESSVDESAAEKACAHWGEGKDDCVFDVLTTGDLEMAMAGAY